MIFDSLDNRNFYEDIEGLKEILDALAEIHEKSIYVKKFHYLVSILLASFCRSAMLIVHSPNKDKRRV